MCVFVCGFERARRVRTCARMRVRVRVARVCVRAFRVYSHLGDENTMSEVFRVRRLRYEKDSRTAQHDLLGQRVRVWPRSECTVAWAPSGE